MGSEAPQVSCLTCGYFKENKCEWFLYFKDESPKDIPLNIKNKGCMQYCDHPLLKEIIKIFK